MSEGEAAVAFFTAPQLVPLSRASARGVKCTAGLGGQRQRLPQLRGGGGSGIGGWACECCSAAV